MIIFRHARDKLLVNEFGQAFDPVGRHWKRAHGLDDQCEQVEPAEALRWLQQTSGAPIKTPVGVIGTRSPNKYQYDLAEAIGRRLAKQGLSVICGGKGGVMEAACSGVATVSGGLSIGLLPDDDPESANAYVTVPIATGIGVARNALLARAACCLVAIGGGYGTLSEIAFALQFERPVLRVAEAPLVQGAISCADADAVLHEVVCAVLRLNPPASGGFD